MTDSLTLTCWVLSNNLLYNCLVLSNSSWSISKSMKAFHNTSGMSKRDCPIASSKIPRARSMSPKIVSNSAYWKIWETVLLHYFIYKFGHYGVGRCLIHKSQDLASVGVFNKGNSYLLSMRSSNYISCRKTYAYIQGVIWVNIIGIITLQGSSFPLG